jgi:hypothetical protein
MIVDVIDRRRAPKMDLSGDVVARYVCKTDDMCWDWKRGFTSEEMGELIEWGQLIRQDKHGLKKPHPQIDG